MPDVHRDSFHKLGQDTVTLTNDDKANNTMVTDGDGDVVMADSLASSLHPPGSAQEAQLSQGLNTPISAPARDHQQASVRDRTFRHVGVEPRQLTSDALQRKREPQLQLLSIPSTPSPHRPAPPDLSLATSFVRRRLFSSPPIPLEFPDENRPPGSLGLGITASSSAGRTQTYSQNRIVTGKGAQARPSASLIDENEKPILTPDAEKNNERKKHRKRNRKQSQRTVQRKNKIKKIKIKMQLKKMSLSTKTKKSRKENIQPQDPSSHNLHS